MWDILVFGFWVVVVPFIVIMAFVLFYKFEVVEDTGEPELEVHETSDNNKPAMVTEFEEDKGLSVESKPASITELGTSKPPPFGGIT